MDDDQPEETEDMDLGGLDLDAVEQECNKKGKGFVPSRQIELLQAAILKTRASLHLGIAKEPQIASKRKQPKEGEKRGRKTNKQRIVEVGTRLEESG